MAEKPLKTASAGSEVGKKRMREEKAAKAEEPTAQKAKTSTQLRVELSPKTKQRILAKVLKEALPNLKFVAYQEAWKARGLFTSAVEAQKVLLKRSVEVFGDSIAVVEGSYPEEVRFECRPWFEKQLLKACEIPGAKVLSGNQGMMTVLVPAASAQEGKSVKLAGTNVWLISPHTPLVHLEADIKAFLVSVVKGVFPNAQAVRCVGHADVLVKFATKEDARAVFAVNPQVLHPRLSDSPNEIRLLCGDYIREKFLEALAPFGVVAVTLYKFIPAKGGRIPVFAATAEAAEKLKVKGSVTVLGHSFKIKLEKPMRFVDL